MTLHEDVARIQPGDQVTAIFDRHDGVLFTIEGLAHAPTSARGSLWVGDSILALGGGKPNRHLLRIVSHVPKPAPLYTNRPDITKPRDYDVVTTDPSRGLDLTCLHLCGTWRGFGGSHWTTEELLELRPLTLVGEAIQ